MSKTEYKKPPVVLILKFRLLPGAGVIHSIFTEKLTRPSKMHIHLCIRILYPFFPLPPSDTLQEMNLILMRIHTNQISISGGWMWCDDGDDNDDDDGDDVKMIWGCIWCPGRNHAVHGVASSLSYCCFACLTTSTYQLQFIRYRYA